MRKTPARCCRLLQGRQRSECAGWRRNWLAWRRARDGGAATHSRLGGPAVNTDLPSPSRYSSTRPYVTTLARRSALSLVPLKWIFRLFQVVKIPSPAPRHGCLFHALTRAHLDHSNPLHLPTPSHTTPSRACTYRTIHKCLLFFIFGLRFFVLSPFFDLCAPGICWASCVEWRSESRGAEFSVCSVLHSRKTLTKGGK